MRFLSCRSVVSFLWLLPLISLQPVQNRAQSTGSDTQALQAEKDRAQLEADLATAEKNKAEAEAASLKAKIGSVNTSNLPQGTIKADSVVIEGSYIAYMAASRAAQEIAKHIPCGIHIVFFSASDLDGIRALDALKAQIPLITDGKTKLTEPLELNRVSAAVLPEPLGQLRKLYIFSAAQQAEFAPAAVFAGIDAGMSLLSLFKTDTEFHGVAVTGDDLALQALVANNWKIACVDKTGTVVHPTYAYPTIETDPKKNDLVKQLRGLSSDLSEVILMAQNLTDKVQAPLGKAVDGLRKAIADYHDTRASITALEAKVKAAKSQEEKKRAQSDLDIANKHLGELTDTIRTQYDTAQARPAPGRTPYSNDELSKFLEAYLTDQLLIDVRVQAMKLLQTRMSDFLAALTKPDGNGVTPLVGLLRAQALQEAITKEAIIVNVKFVAAGGNNIIKRNALFSTLRFSGGVVAQYLLADHSGYLTTSGVVACYGGQFGEGDIKNGFKKKKAEISCTP
jgi:hypothetical protein